MAPSSWRWFTFSASICLLAVGLRAVCAGPSELLIDGHWSQVSKYWPLEEGDFFIATDKGHHYVQAQLPHGLTHDLEVNLEYYYSYSKTKPVMQMIPCLENIFLEDEGTDNKNRWVLYKKIVKQADCVARNELAYNVILHDDGDVFAWRKIEIKQAKQRSPVSIQKIEPTTQVSPGAESVNEPPKQMTTAPEPATQPTATDSVQIQPSENSIRKGDSNYNLPLKDNVIESSSKTERSPGKTDRQESSSTPTDTEKPADSSSSSDLKSKKSPDETNDKEPNSPPRESFLSTDAKKLTYLGLDPKPKMSARKVDLAKSSTQDSRLHDDFPIEARPIHRFKRETSSRAQARIYEATCRPSSCNRNLFRMATFSVLIRGLPQLSQEDKRRISEQSAKFLVNLKNKPLKLKARDGSEPIEDVDSCLDLQLYMESNTRLQLLLQDDSDQNKEPRLLETIKRDSSDSTASRWDQFRRCISDYMPKFVPANPNNNQNSLTFILQPVGSQKPGQMAVLLDKQKSGSFYRLHPVRNFLPDVQQIHHSDELNKFWVLDRDGLEKPRVELVEKSGAKLLRVSQIDPSQSSFDLTSRWMQIKDVEILDQPLMFIYRAERVDWIEGIEFQYQRAGESAEDWLSQVVYQDNNNSGGGHSGSNSSDGPSSQQTPAAEIISDANTRRPPAKIIDVPITLKGADSSEFRVRVRHHLKKLAVSSAASTSSQPQPEPLLLDIKSLAFADVCSYGRPYCKNKAPCKPTGAAQAECVCETGHSGRLCERVRPCEVLYDVPDETSVMLGSARRRVDGHSLCRSMNSRCVEQLPVLRCEWNNDQFYQCKKLYRLDASGDVYSTITGQKIEPTNDQQQQHSGSGSASSEPQKPSTESMLDNLEPEQQVQILRKENDEKSKLIIILSVFLVALLVFAVVLVGSMVSRLRVSSSRLRSTRNELQEMSRHQLPSARPAFNSHAQASAPRAYNNSAFDVEL